MFKKKEKETTKVKKIRLGNVNKKNMITSIIALVVAIAMFSGLVYLERYINTPITYKNVVVANSDIPEGTIITADNVNTYFVVKSMNEAEIPSNAYSELESVIGQKLNSEIVSGEMVFEKDFVDTESLIGSFENPVEVSVGISSLADVNAGSIRAGDLVNLTIAISKNATNTSDVVYSSTTTSYNPVWLETGSEATEENTEEEVTTSSEATKTTKEEAKEAEAEEKETETEESTEEAEEEVIGNTVGNITEEASAETTSEEAAEGESNDTADFGENKVVYVMENIYVKEVYDANGEKISSDDKTTPAVIIKFLVEKSDELIIDNAVVNGSSMRISKVVNTREVYKEIEEKQEINENNTEAIIEEETEKK